MNYIKIQNNTTIPLDAIPILDYEFFKELNTTKLMNKSSNHCVNYYGITINNKIKLICCIGDDEMHSILVSSSEIDKEQKLRSFTAINTVYEKFEREIHENFDIKYIDHPWLKPVRAINGYTFFNIEAEELHEVGVGPIHAGVIEPGHFRFICNGEQIMHLEIQLGYQHRGIEKLMLDKNNLLQQTALIESIAGDSVVGHTVAFTNLWESLIGFNAEKELQLARMIALELERIAIHTGDLSALCTDIAYQLGSSVFGRLRTPLINFFQIWCGNRLAKGLIVACRNKYPFTKDLADQLTEILNNYERDFEEMVKELTKLPSVLARFEKTGVVTKEQAKSIGTVGMSAKMSGISRDIRLSHPHNFYEELNHQPIIKNHGDVYSRVQIRREEIRQSVGYIRKLITMTTEQGVHSADSASHISTLGSRLKYQSSQFSISLVEGWRGEICHCAVTDGNGKLMHYKIKDPSFHNWMALALAVRNNEISDFPVCNKSFNLSYCGHDL